MESVMQWGLLNYLLIGSGLVWLFMAMSSREEAEAVESDEDENTVLAMARLVFLLVLTVQVLRVLIEYFDFPTVLTLLSAVTGLIWLGDRLLLKPRRVRAAAAAAEDDKEEVLKEPVVVEYSRSFFPIIVIVLALRSFLVEPFQIPSGSMMPTLYDGDFILVNKYAYGIKLPVINKVIIETGKPQRGDVVVFRYPQDPSTDYIKRVIGIPGDTITYENNRVYVNGKILSYTGKKKYVGFGVSVPATGADEYVEKIGDVSHRILLGHGIRQPYSCMKNGRFVVPEGQIFVMGDNRDNSNDSRFWCGVPMENLVGKAFMIWFNKDPTMTWPRWDRIGTIIE